MMFDLLGGLYQRHSTLSPVSRFLGYQKIDGGPGEGGANVCHSLPP